MNSQLKKYQTHIETSHNEGDLAEPTDLDSKGFQLLELSDTGHKISLYELFKETKHMIKMGQGIETGSYDQAIFGENEIEFLKNISIIIKI